MPKKRDDWEVFLLSVMGSPDIRQIDGLGGANSLTSKVAIIAPSESDNADVDYTFAQVSLCDARVDMKGNCGNISSAVGPYAVNERLIPAKGDRVCIRIRNTNTDKIILSEFSIQDGMAATDGNLEIPGVPGTGAPIDLTFQNSGGAVTGKVLPTGRPCETIDAGFGPVEISIVDAVNPLVFMQAEDLGLKGTELPSRFDKNILDRIEAVRSIAAELCGFTDRDRATKESPAVPKSTIVSAPATYQDMKDRIHQKDDYHLGIRMMSMQKPHQALAISGAICTTMAARIEDTLVHRILGKPLPVIQLGHPGGIMDTRYNVGEAGEGITVLRTARPLMKGVVYTK